MFRELAVWKQADGFPHIVSCYGAFIGEVSCLTSTKWQSLLINWL